MPPPDAFSRHSVEHRPSPHTDTPAGANGRLVSPLLENPRRHRYRIRLETLAGMSMRLEMLQVARLAPRLLADSAGLVTRFVLDQQQADGGFRGRDTSSDLYYSVFAIDCLDALQH